MKSSPSVLSTLVGDSVCRMPSRACVCSGEMHGCLHGGSMPPYAGPPPIVARVHRGILDVDADPGRDHLRAHRRRTRRGARARGAAASRSPAATRPAARARAIGSGGAGHGAAPVAGAGRRGGGRRRRALPDDEHPARTHEHDTNGTTSGETSADATTPKPRTGVTKSAVATDRVTPVRRVTWVGSARRRRGG